MTHVDDFIDDAASDRYAAAWFESYRRPAIDKARKPVQGKLFATYRGARYRVTGCSRLGDVWLSSDFGREMGYERRVDVAECSDWSAAPDCPFTAIGMVCVLTAGHPSDPVFGGHYMVRSDLVDEIRELRAKHRAEATQRRGGAGEDGNG